MTQVELYAILAGLGAYHGINPGMGWLFAVALAMQRKSTATLYKALVSLTLGHAAAILVVIAVVGWLGEKIPFDILKIVLATLLFGLGCYHILRTQHPSWFGMNIGVIGLFFWSFFMASAHGAGLMLLPVLMGNGKSVGHDHSAAIEPGIFHFGPFEMLGIIGIHTLGYAFMAGLLSFVVYQKLGVSILRKAWINFDLIWAVALIITGGFLLFS